MATNESIIKAIQKIKKTAQVSVSDNNIDTIIWENGETPISKSDIEAQIPVVEQEIENTKTNNTNKKASGKQKLKDLGLDDDEIKALMGV
tara:strand:- start:124 stop:393 length:270 start_codon:yes stop_codon:yes gene_type:complete